MHFAELTPEQKATLAQRYRNGEIMREIAPDFNVSERTISEWLKRLGVQSRRRGPTPEEMTEIIARYENGESTYSIEQDFPFSRICVRSHLIASGVQLRDKLDILRKYDVDAYFFDGIDCEEKAYWLGFILADGYCRRQFIVQLAYQDIVHLRLLRSVLQSTHPIKIYVKHDHPQARLVIDHRHLTKTLRQFPITPKSALRWPDLDHSLVHHFVRGYSDGDGGFYSYSYQPAIFVVTTANFDFMNALKTALVESCDLPDKELASNHNSHAIRWSGLDYVGRIYEYLYHDATVWLPRKRNTVDHLFQ